MTARARLALVLAVAGAVRLVPIFLADRMVGDVLRYRRVAVHVLDVSWNPYEAPRLYPYPPVWVWVEAGSEWLARHTGWSFAVLVKLPVLAADLAIVALLAAWGPRTGRGLLPAWLYALHPVSVLVGAFHGQFDAVALFFVLLAVFDFEAGRRGASAIALAAAIALKSFPVLLLPVFLLAPALTPRARLRFAALAVLPVALLLVPYALADFGALRRELFGYGGIADLGWIGFWRGLRLLHTGVLTRSEAPHWGGLVAVSKALTILAEAALLAAMASRRVRWPTSEACLAALLAFLVFYGSVSAQYLLWVVPFGVWLPDRFAAIHGIVSTMALVGLYAFLVPGVLYPGPWALLARPQAAAVWVVGTGSVLLASAAWLGDVVARGRARAKTEA
ncbi:MAG TPA: hypothetical protein VGN09_15095 [Vicinamibacteria bacterium]